MQIKTEKPSEDRQVNTPVYLWTARRLHLHQEPSVESFQHVPVSKPRKRSWRKGSPGYQRLNSINGLVLPSTLKPGQPPFKSPRRPIYFAWVRSQGRNKGCRICGDWLTMKSKVNNHFVHCVRRNGNPQGNFWDDAFERRKWSPRESDLEKLNAVSGIVSASKLKPGQPPIKSPYRLTARSGSRDRDKDCSICGDYFTASSLFKTHFVPCVGRNGALDDGRRIWNGLAELFRSSDGGGDHDTETSTSDESSDDDDAHTIGHEQSQLHGYSRSSTSRSLAVVEPSLRYEYTGASSQTQSRKYLQYEKCAINMMDEEVSHSVDDTPEIKQEQRPETSSKTTQVIGPLHYRLL